MQKFSPNKIKLARESKNVTHKELASAIKVSRMMIGRYESGQIDITVNRLSKISEYLNKPISYFFEKSEDSINKKTAVRKFIIDLTKKRRAYGNRCKTVAKLLKTGVNPVPNPFCLTPKVFNFYLSHDAYPEDFEDELIEVYIQITQNGYKANVRTPDIKCKSHPNLNFMFPNKMFIESYDDFKLAIFQRMKAIKDVVLKNDIKKIEVSFLLQSTYDSHMCGIIQTDDGYGNIRIEAAYGQHTNIISRHNTDPDVYIVSKPKLEILRKRIGTKKHEFISVPTGVKQSEVSTKRRHLSVFTDESIIKFAKNAIKLEKRFGPQEIECAITFDGKHIIQETRDMKVVKKEPSAKGVQIIFPKEVTGEVLYADTLLDLPNNCKNKIIVTNNYDIQFITMLVHKHKPKAVISLQGTVTSHASTILRESKVVSYIIKTFSIPNNSTISIKKNGETICR